jgi:hypothetical protein
MEDFKKDLYLTAVDNLKNDEGKIELQSAAGKILESAKVVPRYTLLEENPTLLEESRQKLNTEAGIVIANHPGYYDNYLIVNAISRPDIKIVASNSAYNEFYSTVGEDFLIKATHDPREIHAFMAAIKEHIDAGGLVLLYPTAGVDRVDKNLDFEFKRGLSLILKRCMKPTDMVYSFYIEPEDIRPIVDETLSRLPGAASAITLDRAISTNSFKESAEVKVGERYSTAEEWLQVAGASGKDTKNAALSEHFLSQFK